MYKQVIVVRKDLGMSKGKLCVQVAHASLEAYKKSKFWAKRKWEREGAKKIVVGVDSLEKLKKLYTQALSLGIPCSLISDAGKTELKPGTVTALGIGPDRSEKIDRITGKLKTL